MTPQLKFVRGNEIFSTHCPSALATSCHTLLAKSFQSPRRRGVAFAGSKYRPLPAGKWLWHSSAADQLYKLTVLGQKTERLTARGDDDGTATRTPSAWMISTAFFLHRAKSCSQRGSLLVSGNGLLLPSAEAERQRRRRTDNPESVWDAARRPWIHIRQDECRKHLARIAANRPTDAATSASQPVASG